MHTQPERGDKIKAINQPGLLHSSTDGHPTPPAEKELPGLWFNSLPLAWAQMPPTVRQKWGSNLGNPHSPNISMRHVPIAHGYEWFWNSECGAFCWLHMRSPGTPAFLSPGALSHPHDMLALPHCEGACSSILPTRGKGRGREGCPEEQSELTHMHTHSQLIWSYSLLRK